MKQPTLRKQYSFLRVLKRMLVIMVNINLMYSNRLPLVKSSKQYSDGSPVSTSTTKIIQSEYKLRAIPFAPLTHYWNYVQRHFKVASQTLQKTQNEHKGNKIKSTSNKKKIDKLTESEEKRKADILAESPLYTPEVERKMARKAIFTYRKEEATKTPPSVPLWRIPLLRHIWNDMTSLKKYSAYKLKDPEIRDVLQADIKEIRRIKRIDDLEWAASKMWDYPSQWFKQKYSYFSRLAKGEPRYTRLGLSNLMMYYIKARVLPPEEVIALLTNKIDYLEFEAPASKMKALFPPVKKLPPINRIVKNKRSPRWPTRQQQILYSKLREIPMFVVANGIGEITNITPRPLLIKDPILKLSKFYRDMLYWKGDYGPVHVTLGFIDHQDARDYASDLAIKDWNTPNVRGVFHRYFNLAEFYKLNRTSPPEEQFVFIPDTTEVVNLVEKYAQRKHVVVHPEQSIKRRNWLQKLSNTGIQEYQGQPIYIYMPVKVKHKDTEQVQLSHINVAKNNIEVVKNDNSRWPVTVFFRYQDAIESWEKFKKDHPNFKLPKKPNLLAYNLEDFLIMSENTNVDNLHYIQFIPSSRAVEEYLNQEEEEYGGLPLKNYPQLQEYYKQVKDNLWLTYKRFRRISWFLFGKRKLRW